MNVRAWKEQVDSQRRQKDVFFASHPQSPIPHQDHRGFSRLAYYPPDPAYRFELPLHEHADKRVLRVEDTGGNVRELVRWGEFRFEVEGRPCALQAYKDDPAEGRLFLPFKDQTTGGDTYGAGRYLDLEPARHRAGDGRWTLDFNQAYNPWCAYSEAYVCPFVPPENWLDVPIRAGEKNYPLAEK